jgi:tetratricopeptide (TPR) repeat protein/tRNA A-37 threonylcarbamoyl transferase component Bud32
VSSGPPQPEGTSPVEPGQLTALLLKLAEAPAGADAAATAPLRKGDAVDRFVIERQIGQGGFGIVFEATDPRLGRRVALKLVRAARRVEPGSARLLEEAEAAARLSHPNIVTLFDVGQCPLGPYLVQELLRGESLAERLARGPVPVAEAVRIALEVARGLAHAHQHAVIHRDLKPDNVFLCEDGQVKVLDFGMAQAFGQGRVHGGTPAYMAPEQRSGAPEDERTDVYALGVTLYQLLTEKLPFGSDGQHRPLLPAAPLVIPESPALSDLVQRMLERDPVRRPRHGAEVVEALLGVSSALSPAPAGPARPVRRRRRWPLVVVVVAVAVAVSAGTVVLRKALPGKAEVPARLLLAVSDIVNETGEKELELSGLLRTVLEQSTFLEVLPRGRLIDALSRPPEDGPVLLDEPTAQAAARAVSARYLLLARLLKLGETYLLEVRAIEPASGTSRFSFKEQVLGKNSLSGMVDTVAERARLLLGENPEAIRASTIPTGMVTGSLEAWRAYSAGMACFERQLFALSFGPCLQELEKAVSIDPGFALAHLQISVVLYIDGRPRALQQDALRKAQAHPDRVPPHDRRRLEGWAALMSGREEEAKSVLRRAAEVSPDDKLAWYLAGEIPYHRDEFAEALPIFRRIHKLNPSWTYATRHLAFALGVTNDMEELRQLVLELDGLGSVPGAASASSYARLWFEPASALASCKTVTPPDGSESDACVAVALLNLDSRDELDVHLDVMEKRELLQDRRNGFAWYMKFMLLGQEGRWPAVERIARAERVGENAWFHGVYAELIAGTGESALVGREALRIIEVDRSRASSLAVHLAYLGDLRRAAELERYLPPGSPRVSAYQALVRWRSGDLPGAIPVLQRLAAEAPVSVAPAIPPPLFLLGEALAEAGRDAEAIDAFRRYRRIPMMQPTWFWPRSQWFLARSLERLGDHDGARQALSPLLLLWRNASADQPYLAEARTLGHRLGLH